MQNLKKATYIISIAIVTASALWPFLLTALRHYNNILSSLMWRAFVFFIALFPLMPALLVLSFFFVISVASFIKKATADLKQIGRLLLVIFLALLLSTLLNITNVILYQPLPRS